MQFDFAPPARIVFASGAIDQLPSITREFGTRALLVTGRDPSRASHVISGLKQAGFESVIFSIDGEPTVSIVRSGVQLARDRVDVVIGFSGGSAIDAAKAIAALIPNSGEPLDYLEVVGQGRPLERPPLPFIAVPTTAGTGAEVTRNAVLGSPKHGVKASLRSPLMLAKVALIDPDLTVQLPPHLTASTGLDALTQLIEAYVSVRANPFTDLFCVEGMKRVSTSLRTAFREGGNREARESMSFASLLSGLALANAGLGIVHGFAAPLGGMLNAPHGALCAAVLPHGISMNIRALRERASDSSAIRRYREAARILCQDRHAEPEDGVAWVTALCRDLSIARLGAHGLVRAQIPTLVEKAGKTSSMKGNPIPLAEAELTEVAERAL